MSNENNVIHFLKSELSNILALTNQDYKYKLAECIQQNIYNR